MRELGVTGRFLLLPCSRQANYRHLLLKDEEGQVVDQIHAQLCPPEQQEYVTLVHTQEFADRGMRLTLTADNRVSQFAKPQGEPADEAQLALQESWPYYAETVEGLSRAAAAAGAFYLAARVDQRCQRPDLGGRGLSPVLSVRAGQSDGHLGQQRMGARHLDRPLPLAGGGAGAAVSLRLLRLGLDTR